MAGTERTDEAYWGKSWDDILEGGPSRWKDGEKHLNYKLAHDVLTRHGALGDSARVFVPLAGDAAMVPYLHRLGHTVVANEFVSSAVESMKKRFNEEIAGAPPLAAEVITFTQNGEVTDIVKWESNDGRAAIYEGDFFKVKEQPSSFDVVFDKDAFGALSPAARREYVKHIAPLVRPGGYVFLECKDKSPDPNTAVLTEGPPYHIGDEEVRDTYLAAGFEQVERIGDFFPLKYPHWKEAVFILKKKA